MFVSLLFWLALLLPGYALARLVDEDDAECGLMGMIGLAPFWAFALLSPVTILCYVLHLPVAVLSVASVAAVIAGAVVIQRRRWWRSLGRLVVGGLGLELALVAADLVMGGRVGAFMTGDAEIHLARIRYLLDHGFSNYDPFSGPPSFFALYHTNLLHGMQAACARLTGVNYLDSWAASIVWAKAVACGGVFYFAWSVLRSRWSAWAPAIYALALVSPVMFLLYPNQLAIYWLTAVMLGLGIQALRSPGWRVPVKLAAASVVLGGVHALYAIFAGLAIAPVFGVTLVLRLIRRRPDRRTLMLGMIALLAGAPFPLVGRFGGDRPPPDPTAERRDTPDERALNAEFGQTAGGWTVMRWSAFMEGEAGWRLALLGGGGALLVFLKRRTEGLGLLGMSAAVLIALFFPPACTLLIKLFGERWVLTRIGGIVSLCFAVAVVGGVALAVERWRPRWWTRGIVAVVAALLGVWQVYDRPEHGWKEYAERAGMTPDKRRDLLRYLHARTEFCADNIPAGSTVLAIARQGRALVSLCDCFIVTPDRGNGIALDVMDRRRDLDRLLAGETPWEERRALLEKYHIDRYVLAMGASADLEWVRHHLRGQVKGPGTHVLILKLD